MMQCKQHKMGFCIFNDKNLFLFKTPKNRVKRQTNEVCWFSLKNGFSQPWLSFNLFVIFLRSHDVEQVTSALSV